MPITPYLKNNAFDPETTKAMGTAFEKVCLSLGLSLKSDPATEHVASFIIGLAQKGERDAERMYDHVLAHFGKSLGK